VPLQSRVGGSNRWIQKLGFARAHEDARAVGQVCLFFNDKLFRAVRSRCMSRPRATLVCYRS
jgi:hypothetical protein